MKYLLIITFSFFIFSCGHNIPIANLEFVKIEKNYNYENSFFITIKSDLELVENLKKEHTGLSLKCFFTGKKIDENDFLNYQGYYLQSIWEESELINKTQKEYVYKIKVAFYDSGDNNNNLLENIYKLINKNKGNCLNCVSTSVAYMNIPNRYISETMCIPTNEIKKLVKK